MKTIPVLTCLFCSVCLAALASCGKGEENTPPTAPVEAKVSVPELTRLAASKSGRIPNKEAISIAASISSTAGLTYQWTVEGKGNIAPNDWIANYTAPADGEGKDTVKLVVSWQGGTATKSLLLDWGPVRPRVKVTKPDSRETNVDVTVSQITVDFERPLAPSIPDVALQVKAATENVSGVVALDGGGKTLVFKPGKVLLPKTKYTVTVSAEVAAKEGALKLGEDYEFSFTTGDLVIPKVVEELDAEPRPLSAIVTWKNSDAETYNLYQSTASTCDTANYGTCPAGKMIAGVTSPQTVRGLTNGTPYYFWIQSVSKSGGTSVSKPAFARPDILVPDDVVKSVVRRANGNLYLAGDFYNWGVRSGAGVVLDSTRGRPVFPEYPMVAGRVYAAVADGIGGWFIGGKFDRVGSFDRLNLAHILANGNVDAGWTLDTNGYVSALVFDGNNLFIGGGFTKIGGADRSRLAAAKPNATLYGWNPSPNDTVSALAVAGNTVYIGGYFTQLAGTPRSRIAAVNYDGALLDWNPNADDSVRAIAVSQDLVYLGGQFSKIGNSERKRLASVSTDGTLQSWNPGANGTVRAIATTESAIYVGGEFTQIGETERGYLASISKTGFLTPWAPRSNFNVYSMTVQGNSIFIGGGFSSIDGKSRNRAAAVNGLGELLDWNPFVGGSVLALAVTENAVFTGGNFTSLRTSWREYLAALDSNGELLPWRPDPTGKVNALVDVDGILYAGGEFTQIGQTTRNRLAAIKDDGTLVSTWNPNANGTVNSLSVTGNSIYIGGAFTRLADQVRGRAASVDTSGSLLAWSPTVEGAGIDSNLVQVRDILLSGNAVQLGGLFHAVNGSARNLAASVTFGNSILPWNPNVGRNIGSDIAQINRLARSGDVIFVGGLFNALGSTDRWALAATDLTGAATNWNPSVGVGAVNDLSIYGGRLYVGGTFTDVGGQARNRLAAFELTANAAGANDAPHAWNPNANGPVNMIKALDDGVYMGGQFTVVNGEYRPYFAKVPR